MKCLVRPLIFIQFFLIFIINAFSQNAKIDSLNNVLQNQKEDSNKVNTLIVLGRSLFEDSQFEVALQHLRTSLALSEKINFKRGSGRAHYFMASTYNGQFNYNQALTHASLALKDFEGGETRYVANTYLLIGEIYYNQDIYSDALKNYYAALKHFEQIRDSINIIYTEIAIATVYHSQKNYSDALKVYKDALKRSEEIANERLRGMCSLSMGVLYFEQDNYAEALRMDSTAFEIFEKTGDKKGIAVFLYETGKVFERQGQLENENGGSLASQKKYNQALNNYHSALKIFEELGNEPWGLVNTYINLGNLNTRLRRFAEARNYYQKCIQLSRTMGNKFELRDSYFGLSNLDSIQGDYKQAYKNYRVYILYRDSMANDEVNKASLRAKLDYEFEKKEAVSKAEQQKKEAEALLNERDAAIARLGDFFWTDESYQSLPR